MCELGFAGRVAIFGCLGPQGTSTHRLVDLLCVFLKAARSLENALVAFICFAAAPGQPHFACTADAVIEVSSLYVCRNA